MTVILNGGKLRPQESELLSGVITLKHFELAIDGLEPRMGSIEYRELSTGFD